MNFVLLTRNCLLDFGAEFRGAIITENGDLTGFFGENGLEVEILVIEKVTLCLFGDTRRFLCVLANDDVFCDGAEMIVKWGGIDEEERARRREELLGEEWSVTSGSGAGVDDKMES